MAGEGKWFDAKTWINGTRTAGSFEVYDDPRPIGVAMNNITEGEWGTVTITGVDAATDTTMSTYTTTITAEHDKDGWITG